MLKPITISVVDFSTNQGLADRILDWVVDRYDVRFVTSNADFVLHSCYGYDVLRHHGVRIFVTGENVRPDFNICDYAMGFDRIDFGERYCRLPLYRLYKPVYEKICRPRPPAEQIAASKSEFCAFVASNMSGDHARQQIFELLDKYKTVSSGGRWRNNTGGPVSNKYAFQARCKFALAFENASTLGYVTEKIADAMASDAIPIYWGDPDIAADFNPAAFVNCMAYESLEAAVEQIKKIDNDYQLYLKMLREPWFKDGIEPSWLSESHYRRFLSSIFDQPPEQAFRRNRGRWGAKYEQRLATAFFRPPLQVAHSLRFLKRRYAAQRTPYQWQPVPNHVTADTLCLDNTELATPRGVAGPCSAR